MQELGLILPILLCGLCIQLETKQGSTKIFPKNTNLKTSKTIHGNLQRKSTAKQKEVPKHRAE
jgi:hypothetical protein